MRDGKELEQHIWETIWSPTIVKTPQKKLLVLKIKEMILADREIRGTDDR